IPAAVEDTRRAIDAREKEKAGVVSDSDLGDTDDERVAALDAEIKALKEKLEGLEGEWKGEQTLVTEILDLRGALAKASAEEAATPRADLKERFQKLEAIEAEKRMIYAHVDEQAVASVVSDWTGIPVGRMVKDEVETVLNLADILNRRVIGQAHGLRMIAKRIETNRARL